MNGSNNSNIPLHKRRKYQRSISKKVDKYKVKGVDTKYESEKFMLNILDEQSKSLLFLILIIGIKPYDHDTQKSSIAALDSQGEEQEELKRKRKSKE